MEIAAKVVKHDIKPLESFANTRPYQIKVKLMNGEKLTRDEKSWLSFYNGWGTQNGGWYYSFRPFLTQFIVKRHGAWEEYWAYDRTALRSRFGKFDQVVKGSKPEKQK